MNPPALKPKPPSPNSETPTDAQERIRAEIRARMGGPQALLQAHQMAVASLYADQARGYTLD
jgi:hypothetical protein